MNQLNKILLEGVVATDPEVAATCASTKRRLVKFVLANDRYYKDRSGNTKQETMFIPVQCWGDLGERCLQVVKKGMHSRCVGRLMMCRWQSKSGDQRASCEVVCDHLEYRSPKVTPADGPVEVLEDNEHESELLSDTVVLYEF